MVPPYRPPPPSDWEVYRGMSRSTWCLGAALALVIVLVSGVVAVLL